MAKKAQKSKNPLKRWYLEQKALFQHTITKAYYRDFRNILSNSAYRIVFAFLLLGLLIASLYLFLIVIQSAYWIAQVMIFILFFALIYLPAKFFYISTNQLFAEIDVNLSFNRLMWAIENLRKPNGKKNYRSLQANINRVRTNLLYFLEYSEILSPPIFNYELKRLQKRIDVFFNCASEVLVPINKLFSRADEFEEEVARAQHESLEYPPDEEYEEMAQEEMRAMTGEICDFDLRAMNESIHYLRLVMFEKEAKRFSPFSFRHPVNLIMLSRFFSTWNSIIASCSNSKATYEKASKDVEEYYKLIGEMESEERQRKWRLRDNVLVVLISVGISTLIQYLISIT